MSSNEKMNLNSHAASQTRALKHPQAGTAAELDTLLPAILDRAFKGELQMHDFDHSRHMIDICFQ
jgi:hypothetical protein